jgi:outer membrane protein assembly factor BamB
MKTTTIHWLLLSNLVLRLSAADWPQFRGPGGSGVSDAKGIPITWDAQSNIRWKVALPGPGASSPVLFGDRIYLTCYTGYGIPKFKGGENKKLTRHLLCLKRSDGTLIWNAPKPSKVTEWYSQFTDLHGFASSTPAVDADGIYVYYGASGIAAYSHDGQLKWEKECGTKQHEAWGSGSSPVLYKDLVIIHADVESETIFAFDRKTGREVWQRKYTHAEQHNQHTRATPLIRPRPEGDELVIHSRTKWVSSLNPANGETRWEFKGTTGYQHPSIVTDGEVFYALTTEKATAVRRGGTLAWPQVNRGAEVVTPVYFAGHLYWGNEHGMANCIETGSGKLVYTERIQPSSGRIYASGVLAEGRIYYVSREKGTYVIAAQPKYELLAHNVIEDDNSAFNATPALEDGRIYLRSDKYLYCVGTK